MDSKSRNQVRVALWCTPERLPIVRAVRDRLDLVVCAAGSPGRGESGALAERFNAQPIDDLRSMFASGEAELFWILDPGPFGDDPADAAVILSARQRGAKILVAEPVPSSTVEVRAGRWARSHHGLSAADACDLAPLVRHEPAFAELLDAMEQFRPVRTLRVDVRARERDASLALLLFDAMEVARQLMGEPETIDAAYAYSVPGRPLHALPGETLRDLKGDIAFTGRYADGRVVSGLASDQAGAMSFSIEAIGPSGELSANRDRLLWRDAAGEVIEDSKWARAETEPDAIAAAAVAGALQRVLEDKAPTPAPGSFELTLSMCQAALLSARTGQGESPAMLRRIAATA